MTIAPVQPAALKPDQQQIHDFLVDRPFAGAWLGIGGGKAQPLDAQILTPTGFIRMGDAHVGTEVVTPSGDVSTIDGVFPQGVRPVYELRLHDGRVVVADEDHIWSVGTNKHRAQDIFVCRTTRQLFEDVRLKSGSPKWSIASIAPVDLGKWTSSIDPWLLGVLLGDGGLTGSPTLSMPDAEILTAVTALLPTGISPVKRGDTDDYYLTNSHEWHGNTLLGELRRIGVWGHGSATKSVPDELLHAPVSDRLALLQGLLDTDGTPCKSGFDIVLKSEQLADDVRWLIHSLGGRASKNPKAINTGPYAGNLYHRVYGRLPNGMDPFRLPRKRLGWHPHNQGHRRSYDTMYTSISEISFKGFEETQCVRVAHPSHEYVTNGFVRTHNTLTTLRVLQTVRPAGHILVIAPVAIARSTWLDEIDKWQMRIRTRSLIVNERDRKLTRSKRLERYEQVFTDPPTMYFINQELVEDLVAEMPTQKVNGHDTIMWPFQTVVIDESQGFKSHSSNRFKALRLVRPAITRLIELTGTPAPSGLPDLWSQVYLLDQGQSLGANITAFRNRWFIPKMTPGVMAPTKWIPTANAEEEIHQAISHLVMSMHNTRLNLPPLTIEDNTVTLTADLLSAYKDFRKDLVLAIVRSGGDTGERSVAQVVAENQAVLTSKLMQFASGTLYTGDPDDPSTHGEYELVHDAKLEMAEYLIRNSGGDPVLLAYHFRSDKEQLLLRLNKAGIAAEAFDGSRGMLARWNAKQIPLMLIHPASAGHGLNLQHGGSTMIWYTLPFSLEHYLQTNGRLYRTGQTRPVTIHRLITKGTQDERMPAVLAAKQATQDNLLDAVDGNDALLAALESELNDDLNEMWAAERL